MLQRKRTLLLEVPGGLAKPESIALEAGRELDPVSVGTDGAWHVEGPGVLEVHVYVCFDGSVLYVQSADETNPALIDGRPALGDWREVSPPATIKVGSASIVYRSLSDDFDDQTEADPPGQPAPGWEEHGVRPFAPGALASGTARGDEATRLQRMPRVAPAAPTRRGTAPRSATPTPTVATKRPTSQPPPRPSAPAPKRDSGATRIEEPTAPRPPPPRTAVETPSDEPSVIVARSSLPPAATTANKPIDLPPAAPPPAPPPPPSGGARVAAAWRRASGPKKALVLLLPFAIAAVGVIFRDEPAPAPRPSKPAATATSTPTSTSTSTSTSTATSTATSTPTPTAPPSAILFPPDGGLTLERVAVDAVAAGAYADAIRAYDQLAAAFPERTSYAEAARILRTKLDAGR